MNESFKIIADNINGSVLAEVNIFDYKNTLTEEVMNKIKVMLSEFYGVTKDKVVTSKDWMCQTCKFEKTPENIEKICATCGSYRVIPQRGECWFGCEGKRLEDGTLIHMTDKYVESTDTCKEWNK